MLAFSGESGLFPIGCPDFVQSAQRTTESLPILPMTVKQLSEASQSGDEKSKFVINGVDVNMVSSASCSSFSLILPLSLDSALYNFHVWMQVELVGLVFDKSARSSDVGFYLDDGTGRVFCIKW